MATITINGNSLDPLEQTAALHAFGLDSADSSESDYILIQAKEPLAEDQKQQLKDLGVEILEYVPDDTYIAHYSAADLSPVRQLPFGAWAGLYPKQVKVEPTLPPTSTGFDRTNHVEQVIWSDIAKGDVEITVRAFRVPVSPQSYALVVRML